jgi:histidine triad (HIT) family protein
MSTLSCIFCKIIAGQAPARIVYRDELVTAFWDAHPQSPVHILVVPNQHLATLNDAASGDEQAMLGRMVLVGRQLAGEQGIDETGYRLLINTGPQAGQTVYHVHLHLLGGRPLRSGLG